MRWSVLPCLLWALGSCAGRPTAPSRAPSARAASAAPAPAPAAEAPGAHPPASLHAPPDAFEDGARREHLREALPALERHFAELAQRDRLPGLAVGLVVDGELFWSHGYGERDVSTHAPVDADSVFRIGSITKTFTAAAVLMLRDERRLSLDEPASRFIPELDSVLAPSDDSPPITLRLLLTHSSGLPRVGSLTFTDPAHPLSEAELTASLKGLSLLYTPGTEQAYSNLGVALAGIALERAAGMRYEELVTRRLLEPLGMRESVWSQGAVAPEHRTTGYQHNASGELEVEPPWELGAFQAAGGLYSSVRDLGRWAALHLAAYPARDGPDPGPVRRATLREAMRLERASGVRDASADPAEPHVSGIGLVWQVFDDCELEQAVWHNGATEGYTAALAMLPARGVALIALTNLLEPNDSLTQATLLALRQLAHHAPRRVPQPNPVFSEVRDRLLALYDDWDDARASALLTPQLVAEIGGIAQVRAARDALMGRLGRCTRGDSPQALGVLRTRFNLSCERGQAECDATLASIRPLSLASVGCNARVAPSPALKRTAERLVAALGQWSETTYRELLAPSFARNAMRELFATIARDSGECALGPALSSDGNRSATFRVPCSKQALRLELSLDEHGVRVQGLRVTPEKRGACADSDP